MIRNKTISWCTGVLLIVTAALSHGNVSSETRTFVVSVDALDGMKISTAQIAAHEAAAGLENLLQVSLQEEFRSDEVWFLSVHAPDQATIDTYLARLAIQPVSVYEALFVNSPEVGGGPKAGSTPSDGHHVYMIQRSIPGIGLAPLEKKIAVSKGSQKIIESMNGAVEWDRSFLTTEGTFCVYRAGDLSLIEEHARIAGIPANPITKVEHIVRNFRLN